MTNPGNTVGQTFTLHFRCRQDLAAALLQEPSDRNNGFFCFGENTVCYGSNGLGHPGAVPDGALHDALKDVVVDEKGVRLPFDLDEIVDNLRFERYIGRDQQRPFGGSEIIHKLYYIARPFLQTRIRRMLQSFSLRGWKSARFPAWPVDTSVENIFTKVMARLLEAGGNREEPFIWFWPDQAKAALIMTHDVETDAGLGFLPGLMDINDEYGVAAAIQLVPEQRYTVSEDIRRLIRERGFELGVQDLNHDGHLFDNESIFRARAEAINAYARRWGAVGFRAGALYRNQAWYNAFNFEYDMSVPNVGHLEAQRGGCCTLFPYFNGRILELPLTTTQDYTLFNLLRQWSTQLWVQQIERILEHSGLISFIVHPDYVMFPREQEVYRELLAIIADLKSSRGVWVARPKDVNRWWRDRAQSELVHGPDGWKVRGPASERATVAYARLRAGNLVYGFEPSCSNIDCKIATESR
jgi:hypothetical protein